MRKQREEKGITLIALIITIIVLLILAGVSIAMLTGENGILKRAEGTEIVQAQAELTEEIQLALMESLIDIDNAHTIDNILKIAVANSYISLDGSTAKHMLIDEDPTGTLAEITEEYKVGAKLASTSSYSVSTNTYVTDDCEEVTVVDKDLGVWVTIWGTGSNIQITSGTSSDTKDVANIRIIEMIFGLEPDDGSTGNETVEITVTAKIKSDTSRAASKIESITTPEGATLKSLKEEPAEDTRDTNLVAVYEVTKNGVYKFKATETHGGTVTESTTVTNAQYAEIQMVSDVAKEDWGSEVNVTITYDPEFDTAITASSEIQYSTDGTNWTNAVQGQEVKVTENNTTVYARYFVNGKEQEKTDIVIENIDNTAPEGTEFEVDEDTITENSFEIKITKEATETQSGVVKYEAIVTLGETEKVVELKETDGEIKATVDGLNMNTTYLVKVRTTDDADNYGETAEQEVKTAEEGISLDYVIAQGQNMYTDDTDMESVNGNYIMTVPAGFIIRDNTNGDFYERNQISQGIVIEDEDGNEFVWVPAEEDNEYVQRLYAVTSSSYYYATVNGVLNTDFKEPSIVSDYDGGSKDTVGITDELLRDEFEEMQANVKEKGGFFIGRYEMSVGTSGTAESKKGNMPVNSKETNTYRWYGLYAMTKTYINKNNNDITSRMIQNSQYDIMINWMTAEEIAASGRLVETGTSGSNSEDKIRNIYDLTGGRYECTTGAYSSSYRVRRGGDTSSGSASYVYYYGPTSAFTSVGSRLALNW